MDTRRKRNLDSLVMVRMSRRDRALAEAAAQLRGVTLSELARRGLQSQVAGALTIHEGEAVNATPQHA